MGSIKQTSSVDRQPNVLAKLAASAGFFFAGGIVALAGTLAGMASAIVGLALLAWGATTLLASLIVWMPSAFPWADRVLVGFAIASAVVTGLLGFTESGEIAFGACALFVIAALGVWVDIRSGVIPKR